MSKPVIGTEYTPSTLYELMDAGYTEPAATVLADPDARRDYEARARYGLAAELALAWGVAAFAAGCITAARRHWLAAARLAPDDRAIPLLLKNVPEESAPCAPTVEEREAARAELTRIRHNSAFPHRLIRFATAVASEPEDITPAALEAAREVLEQDIREASRSYAMVLPVVRGHYPAVYSLDRYFLDATASVLADHGTRAEFEQKRARRVKTRVAAEVGEPQGPPPPAMEPDALPRVLPRLRVPDRRWIWPAMPRPRLARRLPKTGYAWVGALIGAALFLRDGWTAILIAAAVGFLLAYGVYTMSNRR